MQGIAKDGNLYYINAALVGTPIGGLDELPLCGPGGARIGTLDGILVDSTVSRCCYLVVKGDEPDGPRRHLIPADALIRLPRDHSGTRLEVDADAFDDLDLDLDSIPAMSDRDRGQFPTPSVSSGTGDR